MSAPASSVWSRLIEINRYVDAVIGRAMKAIEPTQPISREVPVWLSLEAMFTHVPTRLQDEPVPTSGILQGNNVRRVSTENGGSRIYLREVSFFAYAAENVPAVGENTLLPEQTPLWRQEPFAQRLPVNFRWNLSTSITQRKYANVPVMARSAGNQWAGSHLSFHEPFVIEPREALHFDCTLIAAPNNLFQPPGDTQQDRTIIVTCIASGYREGI